MHDVFLSEGLSKKSYETLGLKVQAKVLQDVAQLGIGEDISFLLSISHYSSQEKALALVAATKRVGQIMGLSDFSY